MSADACRDKSERDIHRLIRKYMAIPLSLALINGSAGVNVNRLSGQCRWTSNAIPIGHRSLFELA